MASPETHLLISISSRHGRQSLAAIKAALAERHIEIRKIHQLTKSDSMATLCSRIKKAAPELLIIAGGDGTVSSAMHLLAHTNIELGIIPLGTTNNFARSLNLPQDIPAAVDCIVRSQAHEVDLGSVGTRRFANVVGIGLSAHIAEQVSNTTKRRFGRFAYSIVGLREILTHKPFMVTLQDSQKGLILHFETHQVIVANGRYHAGQKIAKDAKLTNHELLVFALGGRRRLSLLRAMLDFYIGGRRRIAHTSYVVGKDFELITSSPQPIEMDGETAGYTPTHMTVDPGAIKVRYPQ
jgi:YegS/Rv2252/BmrU family lipid kinase